MLPTPQELAQVADASRLPALDRIITTLPAAALLLIVVAAVAVAWLWWNEAHQDAPRMRHRHV